LRLSVEDRLNLVMEAPDTPVHMGAVAVLDGRPLRDAAGCLALAEIRGEIDRRLASVPQLHRVLLRPGILAGGPLWIDDPAFRIDRHVDQVEVPHPGDEQALLRLTAELMAPLLDRSRPLWRMWLVTGLPADQVAVVFKLHHVVADGLAAVRMIASLLDKDLDAAQTLPWRAAPPPRRRDLVFDNVRAKIAALPRSAALLTPRRLLGSARAHRRMLAGSWSAPRTSLNAPIGAGRRLAVLRLDLADVKRVAHRHGGKVNDVVLSLAAGGLRTLLRSRGESVDRVWLHASVAVSLRTPEQTGEAGNRTGGIVVRLPVGEPDPGARLRLVSGQSARAKRLQPATAGNSLLMWLARLGLVRRFSRRQHMINLVESNIAGPPAPIYALGARMLDLIPIGHLAGNIALSLLALSYAGRLTVTVQADADQFPDLPVLLAAMEREWAALSDATTRGQGSGTTARSNPAIGR
jgi:diacylglycerol O-acyltransferase